jgi:hypothetical protein
MTSEEVAQALLEWALEAVPSLEGGYAYLPAQKDQQLPDVVVDVAEVEVARQLAEFPMSALQQTWLHAFRCELSFMVSNDDPESAAQSLRAVEALTTASLMRDGTLGGRVDFISPYFSYDFTPPFVEYADGTRGREMVMRMSVGEPIEGGLGA